MTVPPSVDNFYNLNQCARSHYVPAAAALPSASAVFARGRL